MLHFDTSVTSRILKLIGLSNDGRLHGRGSYIFLNALLALISIGIVYYFRHNIKQLTGEFALCFKLFTTNIHDAAFKCPLSLNPRHEWDSR
jgi:hypothetical protein